MTVFQTQWLNGSIHSLTRQENGGFLHTVAYLHIRLLRSDIFTRSSPFTLFQLCCLVSSNPWWKYLVLKPNCPTMLSSCPAPCCAGGAQRAYTTLSLEAAWAGQLDNGLKVTIKPLWTWGEHQIEAIILCGFMTVSNAFHTVTLFSHWQLMQCYYTVTTLIYNILNIYLEICIPSWQTWDGDSFQNTDRDLKVGIKPWITTDSQTSHHNIHKVMPSLIFHTQLLLKF